MGLYDSSSCILEHLLSDRDSGLGVIPGFGVSGENVSGFVDGCISCFAGRNEVFEDEFSGTDNGKESEHLFDFFSAVLERPGVVIIVILLIPDPLLMGVGGLQTALESEILESLHSRAGLVTISFSCTSDGVASDFVCDSVHLLVA